ncbi:MAG: AmmeMemoRadiSam system protein B [Proteobacteria bacterium]|nr:AmmeMemoRadiSam system protein B [Pseudomonadota bacterium]MDA1308365.1 AmmeMemoRadiSam system protein B [Pseudomonadota bacterium]
MALDSTSERVRAPHMAGTWYPAGDNECADMVLACLDKGLESPVPDPKVIVAPHAGLVFSGEIAGTAFRTLANHRERIKRVVIIGPAHRVGFKGLATTSADAWATPLGTVPVDWGALRKLMPLPGFSVLDKVFEGEHSLEVHLPFLQPVLDDFTIVPILVGDASAELVREALSLVWGGPETVISVSSDLSHFHDHATAVERDQATTRHIELLQHEKIDGNGACGHRALAGALELARTHDLRVTHLDVRNSGDTRGGRDRVVGYGAYAMEYAESARISDADRRQLLGATRQALQFGVENGRAPTVNYGPGVSKSLTAMRASFVSLKINGRLRGCIGSVVAHQALLPDVVANAYKAGFGDPRFGPLTLEELEQLDIEVSLLSFPRLMQFEDEADLVRQVRPDKDGLILQDQGRRGLFLPSVWQGLPKAEDFIRQLKRKAGFELDHWSDQLRVFRYTTETFSETFRPVG